MKQFSPERWAAAGAAVLFTVLVVFGVGGDKWYLGLLCAGPIGVGLVLLMHFGDFTNHGRTLPGPQVDPNGNDARRLWSADELYEDGGWGKTKPKHRIGGNEWL